MRPCKADDAVPFTVVRKPAECRLQRSLAFVDASCGSVRRRQIDWIGVEGDRLPAIDAAARSGCSSPRSQPDSRPQGF